MVSHTEPFAEFAPPVHPHSPLRQRITAACRRPEAESIAPLLAEAAVPTDMREPIRHTALALIHALRDKGQRGGVEALVQEYALSSQEGVALMCLAEALLRIPDTATRDALIRDKIALGDWQAHFGQDRPLFVNAATWGLMITGKLTASTNETGLGAALAQLIARCGEPVIRRGIDMAMELMGEQFVTGETIGEALKRARKREMRGFRYSYDMLGEAAITAADATRYHASYVQAIHAIGDAAGGRGVYTGPGISIKLSALHPRYARSQAQRVMTELLPRLRELAVLAKRYDIGLNIDAEEADKLDLSLDLLESLALDPALNHWNGLGFVVQAYGKRCARVIDWLADLARRADRRIMVRLVKGAYWDSEIKRAQIDGLADFPVFTRKVHTDVSYIACARRLLAARAHLFPQFATHNAQTLASIYHLAGPDFKIGDYEFQCLHGMGEPLYEEVVGPEKLDRPCRIYAPVGTHETLLAYLVRRLLENGANASFVHRIGDPDIAPEELAEDPVEQALAVVPPGSPHPLIALPEALFAPRRNSAGLDLTDEAVLAGLSVTLRDNAQRPWRAAPMIAGLGIERRHHAIVNPGDHTDRVGTAAFALDRDAAFAMQAAHRACPDWAATPVDTRADCLDRAADLLQMRMPDLLGLIAREAGKTIANAVTEVREAVDFLRYYAAEARRTLNRDTHPLGVVVCISPWNFPLSIFTGQVAAALVTGNTVVAKPAEETPLIAAEAVRILHAAGIPPAALYFVPGDGAIGATLVAAQETTGVVFTGSNAVASLIQQELADHMTASGAPIPFIAETGGQNAMIVDSSALAEQVVTDVITSAFDSAGQRCSALRVLCLQDDIADRQLTMLKGALAELAVGRTDRLAIDAGPVITAEAKDRIEAHIARMQAAGHAIDRIVLPRGTDGGTFVAPTIIAIDRIDQIGGEVFGPVLHVLRWRHGERDGVIAQINATGYGLTFGLHTRLDETVAEISDAIDAGNIYVNRNVIGAVVGVQPFGGRGLSGTGPKAGGPLYLGRLVQMQPDTGMAGTDHADPILAEFARWLTDHGRPDHAARLQRAGTASLAGYTTTLPGPVGERNLYTLRPRGTVLLIPHTRDGLLDQLVAILATGNEAVIVWPGEDGPDLDRLPPRIAARIAWLSAIPNASLFPAALVEARPGGIASILREIAAMKGPIPLTQMSDAAGQYRLDWLIDETSVSVNTTAAGGNASLMAAV